MVQSEVRKEQHGLSVTLCFENSCVLELSSEQTAARSDVGSLYVALNATRSQFRIPATSHGDIGCWTG